MWIARDKSGHLSIFIEKPHLRKDSEWISRRNEYPVSKDAYPEVTFENSPKELVIKNETTTTD